MMPTQSRILSVSLTAALLAACGGGSGGSTGLSSSGTSAPQSASVPVLISDASTENWSTIGVRVLSIALVPQGGGSNVTVYSAAAPAPMVNLVELDQIAEILGNATVPFGTYSGAVLNVSGNAGDILLTVAADPQVGFPVAGGSTIPASQIQVQHTQGSSPNLTVPVNVNFVSPLVVGATQNNALDLEFDLGHPAFIIDHVPPGSAGTVWAVNFEGPVRHHPVADLRRLVLRHAYGTVDSIAANNSAIGITRDFPTEPVVSPETFVAGTQTLQILADAADGTLFYDVDAGTKTVITNFASETSLSGKYVRIAARYQEDGSLVATRIWASAQFDKIWLSPEGHVLHVDPAAGVIDVDDESGTPVAMSIDADTQFFFRQPQSGQADATPIGTGTSFLSNHNLVRGFKVHASVVDPLATPLVAQSIDIETAKFDGRISDQSTAGVTYTRVFRTLTDDYSYTLNYISGSTANGTDDSGNPIAGFKWWNFAYPTLLNSGTNAIAGYVAEIGGSVNFGGSVGAVPVYGESFAVWGDPANASGWSAAAGIIAPSLLPLGFVAAPLLAAGTFSMTVPGAARRRPWMYRRRRDPRPWSIRSTAATMS